MDESIEYEVWKEDYLTGLKNLMFTQPELGLAKIIVKDMKETAEAARAYDRRYFLVEVTKTRREIE